jgi:hypothetical protein
MAVGKPRVDHLRGQIWEVRTSLDQRTARTLFAVAHGQPENVSVQLDTLIKAARAVGKVVEIKIKRQSKAA